ncbi:MAG: hypothetical protein EBR32_03790, partial [Bacteroidetes bacterium]|nr:hypothetical protein [Bacteroidota bacterium]
SSSPTLRPDHSKEYQVLARTNNLFYAQYVKEHAVVFSKSRQKPKIRYILTRSQPFLFYFL